jgi:hypothetical protein
MNRTTSLVTDYTCMDQYELDAFGMDTSPRMVLQAASANAVFTTAHNTQQADEASTNVSVVGILKGNQDIFSV